MPSKIKVAVKIDLRSRYKNSPGSAAFAKCEREIKDEISRDLNEAIRSEAFAYFDDKGRIVFYLLDGFEVAATLPGLIDELVDVRLTATGEIPSEDAAVLRRIASILERQARKINRLLSKSQAASAG